MKAFRCVALSTLVFVAAVGGCSSESSDSDPDGGCGQLASEVCSALARCGGSAFAVQFTSEEECKTRFSQQCDVEAHAPGSGFGPAFISACSAAYVGKSCDELRYGRIPECREPKGSLPDGSGCAYDSQCASGVCFEPFANAGCGYCFELVLVGEGELCGVYPSGIPKTCADGLECEDATTQSGSVCVVEGGLGAPCGGETKRCAEGLVCQNSKCERAGQAGAPCSSATECDIFAGFVCNPLSDQCAPLAIADGGQPCGIINGSVTLCRDGADCVGLSPSKLVGTCAFLIPEGQPCEYGDSCQGQNICTATTPDNKGTCTVPDAAACQGLDAGF